MKGNRWGYLWKITKGNRILYGGAIVSMILSAVVSLLPPLVIGITIDSIIGNKPFNIHPRALDIIEMLGGKSLLAQNLWVCGLVLIILNIVNGYFQYTRGKWSAQASENIARNVRNELYDHLQNLPYEDLVKAETGDLIQRCTSDVETVRRFLAMQLVEIGRSLAMLVVSLIAMFSLSVKMAWVSISVVPLIFLFSFIFYGRIRKAFKGADEAEGRMSTVLQENLTGIRVVRAFGRQAYEAGKFDDSNAEYTQLWKHLNRLLALFWSSTDLLSMVQQSAVLIFGVYWAAMGELSLGILLTFLSYIDMLLWPVRQLGRILTDMGKTHVSLGRIREIIEKPLEDMNEEGLKPPMDRDIEFKNVYFEYDEGRPVLKDVSFKVKRGQTVAVLGATGTGKSSLVHLLQRLYDYQRGSITIGGVELKDINKRWLRERVGIVLQEPFLFSRSIKDNIALAKKDIGDDQIYKASRIAAVHDVISEFEDGYDTMVGERGVTLSGGQKQRVAIARTLILDSSILIFDDSLSAVDTETDNAIREALEQRSKGITTFIISHRITTISQADIILVMEDGKIAQWGTHRQLLSKEGLYRRIWSIQNSLEGELEKNLA
ncbi:MAG: ABC transporter ATP-binding protein [Clostridiales bacterium]|nr:ABC transporter ATP-binding protein [Clostridiales bacterium]